MTLQEIKLAIWNHKRVKRNPIDLQLFADRAQVRLPITQIHEAEKLLKSLTRKVKKKVETPSWCIERYEQAHEQYFKLQYPTAYKDGFYPGPPDFPDVGTSNGLTRFIVNYATWMGCHANRINTSGRQINGKWITGSTKKGTADTDLVINGRAVKLEVKVGRDKPSDKQLEQQRKVRSAGGVYEFIHDPIEFFEVFDKYYSLYLPKQASLL